jgi:uncharacterized protein YprB with RNaseH-like and TPR domain
VTDDLRGKLARLRREEPRPAAGAPPERTLPTWFGARRVVPEGVDEVASGTARTAGPPGDLEPTAGARGPFAVRRTLHAPGHHHGDVVLDEVLDTTPSEYAWIAGDPALDALGPRDAVYLDIETTGLSGGAGTIPFLVALGRFTPAGFELWQAFLRSPGEEAAALEAVAERIAAASGVVSFFGKSFDRHRLEDKMRLHRIAPPFDGKPHLDLYHPLRRLYRGATVDTRLATFERELCGVERGVDLPGGVAPAAWFDFLAGRAHRLEGVFRHNALDVLSLVTLMAHLARARHGTQRDGRPLPGCARSRARGLAERHVQRREWEAALACLDEALVLPGGDGGDLQFRRGEVLRRARRLEEALQAFLGLARESGGVLAARAWGETLRVARRLKRADIEAEARREGPPACRRELSGRTRERELARYGV